MPQHPVDVHRSARPGVDASGLTGDDGVGQRNGAALDVDTSVTVVHHGGVEQLRWRASQIETIAVRTRRVISDDVGRGDKVSVAVGMQTAAQIAGAVPTQQGARQGHCIGGLQVQATTVVASCVGAYLVRRQCENAVEESQTTAIIGSRVGDDTIIDQDAVTIADVDTTAIGISIRCVVIDNDVVAQGRRGVTNIHTTTRILAMPPTTLSRSVTARDVQTLYCGRHVPSNAQDTPRALGIQRRRVVSRVPRREVGAVTTAQGQRLAKVHHLLNSPMRFDAFTRSGDLNHISNVSADVHCLLHRVVGLPIEPDVAGAVLVRAQIGVPITQISVDIQGNAHVARRINSRRGWANVIVAICGINESWITFKLLNNVNTANGMDIVIPPEHIVHNNVSKTNVYSFNAYVLIGDDTVGQIDVSFFDPHTDAITAGIVHQRSVQLTSP